MKQTKKQKISERQQLINQLIESNRLLNETLTTIQKEGRLEFRVKDAPNSQWQTVPVDVVWEWNITEEDYRVAGEATNEL